MTTPKSGGPEPVAKDGPTFDIAGDVDRDNSTFDMEAERERLEGRSDRLPGD